jgi:phosphoesterase RecJ-like protein
VNSKYRQIYKKIKKYNTIVIARHIGADPDALGSSFGLRDSIKATFPNKNVLAVGAGAAKFKYMGSVDKFNEELYENSLLIVLDTPNISRVDGVNPSKFNDTIKIDHHPFVEEFCNIEWIDPTSSSTSQMIIDLIFNTRLKVTESVANSLFWGLVADTERFLYSYTSPATFKTVAKLIEHSKIDFTALYQPLYMRSIGEIKFQAFLMNNLVITENGFGYVKMDDAILEQYGVDPATAGNMINSFNYIEEMVAWGFFSSDKINNNIRGSIRSRGPIINDVAAQFGGGGHIYASGAKLPDFEVVDEMIKILDNVCKEYKENLAK